MKGIIASLYLYFIIEENQQMTTGMAPGHPLKSVSGRRGGQAENAEKKADFLGFFGIF
jgi:hypothetical protein